MQNTNIQSKLCILCAKRDIKLAYLFGSCALKAYNFVAGKAIELTDPLADIDIGLVFTKPLPPADSRYILYAKIQNDFADIFSPLPVDVSFLEENHSVFQVEAIKGYCIYAMNDEVRFNYEESVLRRAADFRPVLDLFLRESIEGHTK